MLPLNHLHNCERLAIIARRVGQYTPFAGKRWDFGGPYAFANFDTSGPVRVRITSKRSLRNTVVRPQSSGVRLKPVVNQYMHKKVPGFIRNVRFKDLRLTGQPGAYRIQVSGADSEHDVRGVTFENISILGAKLMQNSPEVLLGPHVEGIQLPNRR